MGGRGGKRRACGWRGSSPLTEGPPALARLRVAITLGPVEKATTRSAEKLLASHMTTTSPAVLEEQQTGQERGAVRIHTRGQGTSTGASKIY